MGWDGMGWYGPVVGWLSWENPTEVGESTPRIVQPSVCKLD